LGKAVNRPIYKILGNGGKDRMLAYASSQHLATVEDFGPDALKAKAAGLKGYKIHPGGGQRRSGGAIPGYLGHIDEIKEVRKAVGDDFSLLFDPVQRYNYFEALKVGRVLDQQGYLSFEDPMPTTEIEALVELRKNIDTPIEVGEFILDVYDFPEYIKRGAMDIVRLIADNIGGITGSFRVGQMADAFGLPCTPHNWGNGFDLAVHFQIELALPNSLLGKAFHWHPVRNMKTMPSKTLRGSMAFRPPPARRRYFRLLARFRCGISGSTRFHSSSETAHDMIAPMVKFIMGGSFKSIFIYG